MTTPDLAALTAQPRAVVAIPPALALVALSLLPGKFASAHPSTAFNGGEFSASLLNVEGILPNQPWRPFSAVSGDMDLDGDLDLLINWHNVGPLELFENRSGVFHILNQPGADRAGLFDNRGVPDMYVALQGQIARVEAHGSPGLYVWHDKNRQSGFWRFYLIRESGATLPATLEFEASRPILEVENLTPSQVLRPTPESLRIQFPAAVSSQLFGVRHHGPSSVRLLQPHLQVFAGRHLSPIARDPIKLREPDPHGLTWVDVSGGPEPDLFLTRGANLGTILPPFAPKTDRFYEWVGGRTAYSMATDDTFPANYGRGRQVAWVDIDNDGVNELYTGNEESLNSLAVQIPSLGTYGEQAGNLGLDLFHGQNFAWIDFDEDGFQDLLYLEQNDIAALHNQQGNGFAPVDPIRLGLVMQHSGGSGQNLFDRTIFQIADFDNDGHLDIVLGGVGDQRSIELFLRRGNQYTNLTAQLGLAAVEGASILLPIDADNDSFIDLLKVENHAVELLTNDAGTGFDITSVAFPFSATPFKAATVTDVNSDGFQDVLLVRNKRWVAHNISNQTNSFLQVRFLPLHEEPIGTLVSAHYADGSVHVQRYGSANNPPFSQSLTPLHFGVASGGMISHLSVLWPGNPVPTIRPILPEEIGSRIDI